MNAVLNDDNLKINAETERRRELIISISLRLRASAVKKPFGSFPLIQRCCTIIS